MSKIDRRRFLELGGVGAVLGAWARASAPSGTLLPSSAALPVQPADPRLIVIFLRGGMDGVHTVVPVGDSTYTAARTGPLDLSSVGLLNVPGTTYAKLNPNWKALSPVIAAGQAGFLHQIGNPYGARSHFEEMQILETGFAPSNVSESLEEEGFVPRLGEQSGWSGVRGASVSLRMQRLFRGHAGSKIFAHVRSIGGYTLGSAPINQRQRDLLALHLGQTPPIPIAENLQHETSLYVGATEPTINGVGFVHDPAAFPANLAEASALNLPDFGAGYALMSNCEQALALLRSVSSCRAVGVEYGSWDTHNDQVPERDLLDPYVAHAIASLWAKLAEGGFTKSTILVITEFGRTNSGNSALGTDHGVGGLMMAFGPRVRGGVYNCAATSNTGFGVRWRPLLTASGLPYTTFPNACPVAHDFRLIYAELLHKVFGLSHGVGSAIEQVLPGWTDTGYLGAFV
jgi:uncharacterized protein (DUF1501 family)